MHKRNALKGELKFTLKFHKQSKNVTMINKRIHKYLVDINPTAHKLSVLVKTKKENGPIRPVVKNTHAQS